MSLPKNIKISDQVLFQEIEGECVLLNLANERYFGLNEVGTRFWQLLSENENTADAVYSLQKEYDTDEETLRNDLSILISELSEQGLLTIDD